MNAISYDRIQKVESEIKRQVSVYQARANYVRLHPDNDPAKKAAEAAGYVCGKGLIDFDISSVTLDLTATMDSSEAGSLGFSIPIYGPVGSSIGPSGSVSKEVNNTQELSIPLYPILNPSYSLTDSTNKPAPLADALFALRNALIQGGTRDGICFYDYKYTDLKGDTGGTFKMGLTITDDLKGGIDLKLSVIKIGNNYEMKSVTGNTITVSFHQHDLPTSPDQEGDLGKGFVKTKHHK